MIRFSYFLATVVGGLLFHIFCERYLTVYGVGPNMLLLIVVVHGFFYGPTVGLLLGFTMGLVSDSLGSHLFGLQSLLLTLAGYITGRLRRRVASERPTGQFVIAFTATFFYGFGVSFIGAQFEEGARRAPFLAIFFSAVFNALVMPFVFTILEWWGSLWQHQREHVL